MFSLRSISISVICFSMLLTLPGMLFSSVEIKPADYTDPGACSECHPEIYAQWNGSMHSMAQKDPVYQKLFIIASRETNNTFDGFCTRCHAPIAVLSGEIPSVDNYNLSGIAEKGVSCDFCHTVNASSGTGNGAFLSSQGRVKYGPFRDSNYSTFHLTAYSELHTRAEFCGICHNVKHPFNGLALENTYTEWAEGPYNETTPCQHCHMTPGVTKFKQNPGRAAAGAPLRENIYTHYFVGGNALPGVLGSPEHERLAKERLRSAAKLEIEKMEITNETMNLKVRVTNTGAGHKIPTGLTEARMMWLDVSVRDRTGNMVFRSGEMDETGHIKENAVIYHTVLGDSDGRPTEKVWRADRILLDNRIPPKEYSLETYSFALPQNTKGPLSVEIKLNYASASQELSDLLFGTGNVRPAVIEMASVNKTFDISGLGKKEAPDFVSANLIIVILLLYSVIKCS